MSMDLIIADSGKVMIASTMGFEAEVVRVDFDAQSRTVTLAYGEDMRDRPLPLSVNDRMTAKIIQASRVLLVSLDGGHISGGYDVPLTCTGTV